MTRQLKHFLMAGAMMSLSVPGGEAQENKITIIPDSASVEYNDMIFGGNPK